MFSFSKRLHYVKRKLGIWNTKCFGNLNSMKRLSHEDLGVITRKIRDYDFSKDLGRVESLASSALEEWEPREETFLKKKDRVDWL